VRRPIARVTVIAVISAIVAGASSATAAEPTAQDRALATSLFKEGKALMETGDLAHACPKLEESQRLDPSSGTILNLALCHEQQGRTATAWTDFTEARALAKRDGRDDRIKFAEEHIAALEPKLSKLVIVVPTDVEVPSLRVLRDGSVVGRAAWGGAIPVDPGKHTIEASADGKISWRTNVEVGPVADSRTVTVPKLADAPVEPTAKAMGTSSTWKAGLALTTLGVAWLGAGAFLGLRAISKRHESDVECTNGCTLRGVTLNDDAKIAADASTVSFAVGLVSLGVGGYLLFRPSADEKRTVAVAPSIGPNHGALFLRASF